MDKKNMIQIGLGAALFYFALFSTSGFAVPSVETVNQTQSIDINVNLSDNSGIGTVWINVTLPNGSIDQITVGDYGPQSGRWTYQEDPISYHYGAPGLWESSPGNLVDGDFDSTTIPDSGTGYANLFSNYSTLGNSSSLWRVGYTGDDGLSTSLNITINTTCWDTSLLQLRVTSTRGAINATNWTCWNNSEWLPMWYHSHATYGSVVSEEAMNWDNGYSVSINELVQFNDTSLIGAYSVVVFYNNSTNDIISNTTSFVVNDSFPPDVHEVTTNVSTINQTHSILISANISDDPMSFIDTVLFEINYSNSTIQNKTIYTRSQNSLISQWSFENASAGDNFGSNHGTVSGATYNATGGHDGKGAYMFDGTNDDISMGTETALNPSNFTLSVWISKTATGGDQVVVGKRAGGNPGYLMHYFNNKMNFEVDTDTPSYVAVEDTSDISPNTWTHYVGTYNGSKASLYKNGNLIASSDIAGSVSNSDTFYVGRRAAGSYWNGSIDDILLYNSSLTASQVAALYDMEKNNRFNLSFSDTEKIGGHTITVFANDTAGNMNGTETISFSINDTKPPNVTSVSVNNSSIHQTSFIDFTATVIDDPTSFISDVIFEVLYPDSTRTNYSAYTRSQNELVSQWYFNNASADDNFGSNDGVVTGATYNASGGHDGRGAYMFDGSDSIIFPIDSSINDIQDTISISFWINPAGEGASYQYVLYKRAGEYIRIKYRESDNKLYASFTTDVGTSDYVYSSSLTAGIDYHIILTYDSSGGADNIVLWNNAEIDDTQTYTGQILTGENLSLASTSNGFNGTIDDVSIYNYTLNSSQAKALHDKEKNNRFNLSFSDTSQAGNYTITVFANDTAGNMNGTENSTFEVIDSPYPGISDGFDLLLVDVGNSSINSSTVVINLTNLGTYTETMQFSIFDDESNIGISIIDWLGNDTGIIELNDTSFVTTLNSGTTMNITVNVSTTRVLANYSFSITANTSLKTNNSTLNISVVDLVAPHHYGNNTVNPSEGYLLDTFTLSLDAWDFFNVTAVYFEIEKPSGLLSNYSGTNGTGNTWTYPYAITNALGYYIVNAWLQDSSGNWGKWDLNRTWKFEVKSKSGTGSGTGGGGGGGGGGVVYVDETWNATPSRIDTIWFYDALRNPNMEWVGTIKSTQPLKACQVAVPSSGILYCEVGPLDDRVFIHYSPQNPSYPPSGEFETEINLISKAGANKPIKIYIRIINSDSTLPIIGIVAILLPVGYGVIFYRKKLKFK